MDLEAVVLTGGRSRRMGVDKAKMLVDGVPQADRIVQQLLAVNYPVTVLGPEPITGAQFLADDEEIDGPLAALSRFPPQAELVFVVSCDIPRFDVRIVRLLADRLEDKHFGPLSCAPMIDGYLQPFCAVYMAIAFDLLRTRTGRCGTDWLEALHPVIVQQEELEAAGIKLWGARQANTPEELEAILKDAS